MFYYYISINVTMALIRFSKQKYPLIKSIEFQIINSLYIYFNIIFIKLNVVQNFLYNEI